MATHQTLLYRFSGSEARLDGDFISNYNKRTTPDQELRLEELSYVREHLIPSLDQSQSDDHAGYFGEYKPITTSYGSTLNTVEEAIQYVSLHDAMHFGQIKMIEKLLV